MIPINKDAILSLKNYIDKRESKLKGLCDKYWREGGGFVTFKSFQTQDIQNLIDNEYKKCVIKPIENLLMLYLRVNHTNFIMSARTEHELRQNFIRFLVNY